MSDKVLTRDIYMPAISDAFYEFKEIEGRLPCDAFIAFIDGSFISPYAGSGSVICRDSMVLHEISVPCGRVSIAYAELFDAFCSSLAQDFC